MLVSSGDDGGHNNRFLFLLLSMVLFLSLFISPVYAEELSKPYVPYELSNLNIVKDTDSKKVTFSFTYKGKAYNVFSSYKNEPVNYIFMGRSNCEYFHILLLEENNLKYTVETDNLNFYHSYAMLDLNLDTSEFNVSNAPFTNLSKISYNSGGGYFFVHSTVDIKNNAGGYFFQLPPPPPPTILEGVSLEGVLIQIIYLLPSCLLWIVSYLALRKCIMPLLALLKT